MDGIMLAMKKRGIRFFSKIKFNNTDVKRYYGKVEFLPFVRSRRDANDNILLMAHGGKHAILTTTINPSAAYDIYISSDETTAFRNDFVFAISCLTALEFGKKCVQNGAIAYLGYQVEIGSLFNSYSTSVTNLPKRVSNAIDIMIKRIFVQSLSKAYEEFLCHPISVNTLRERFSYLLERGIVEILSLTTDQIFEKFGIKIQEHHYKKYMITIVLRALSELKEISSRLVCIGEENYISPTFINHYYSSGFSKEQLLSIIETNQYYVKMNIQHQEMIRECILKGVGICQATIS